MNAELTDFSWLVISIVSFVIGVGVGVLYMASRQDEYDE